MSLKVAEIDKILAGLFTKGFIEYVSQGKKTVTTLNPLKEKLYREFQMTSTFEEASKNSKKSSEMINNVYGEFERLLNRPLSQVEFSRIREWVSYGYSDETIIGALKETLSKGKTSLRSVDKTLLAWSEREDRENEGHSPMNETWDKNLEETIRIAKTPWLDQYEDDEDKKDIYMKKDMDMTKYKEIFNKQQIISKLESFITTQKLIMSSLIRRLVYTDALLI